VRQVVPELFSNFLPTNHISNLSYKSPVSRRTQQKLRSQRHSQSLPQELTSSEPASDAKIIEFLPADTFQCEISALPYQKKIKTFDPKVSQCH
jgi:hypothetical protein